MQSSIKYFGLFWTMCHFLCYVSFENLNPETNETWKSVKKTPSLLQNGWKTDTLTPDSSHGIESTVKKDSSILWRWKQKLLHTKYPGPGFQNWRNTLDDSTNNHWATVLLYIFSSAGTLCSKLRSRMSDNVLDNIWCSCATILPKTNAPCSFRCEIDIWFFGCNNAVH